MEKTRRRLMIEDHYHLREETRGPFVGRTGKIPLETRTRYVPFSGNVFTDRE